MVRIGPGLTTRWARVARGLVAAFIATFIAACSHAFSGGSVPGFEGVALCLAFSSVICALLAGRSLSWMRLSVSVGISQFLFHGLFSVVPDSSPASIAQQLAFSASHSHGMTAQLLSVTGAGAPMTLTVDLWMWLGHAGAAAFTVLVLRKGEQSFWHLTTLATLLLAKLLTFAIMSPLCAAPKFPTQAANRGRLPHMQLTFLGCDRLRGPPVFAPNG